MSDTVRVHHDQAGHRFEAMIEGHCAYLAYMDLGEQTLDMYRTFVPDALRGRGIAAAWRSMRFDYAEREGYQVIPSCSYVERYIERNRTGSGQSHARAIKTPGDRRFSSNRAAFWAARP